MIVEFNCDLSMQRILAAGIEIDMLFGDTQKQFFAQSNMREVPIASFAGPRLVFDSDRILRLPPAQREALLALLASSSRVARFSKTEHYVDKAKYPLVWAPSIDTFLMCAALHTIDLQSVGSVAEIGCGSGFIGKYLLERVHAGASVDLVDIDHASVACAQDAIKSVMVSYHMQDAQDFLAQRQFDLVVSNPPYLPSPDGEEYPPFGGTRLLNFLCDNAADFLKPRGRLILLQSSIDQRAIDTKSKGNYLRSRVLQTLKVPLKVTSVLNDDLWCKYLAGLKGIRQEQVGGYIFYHELVVLEISKA